MKYEIILILYLYASTCFQEQVSYVPAMIDIGAKHDWPAPLRRLKKVMPPYRDQSASHKSQTSLPIDKRQFSPGV